MNAEEIIPLLPYSSPFLFVDEIDEVTEEEVSGSYRYRKNESFYAGHFVGNPVTPGVILVETMAQIGLVSLGIFLLNTKAGSSTIKPGQVAFTSANVDFKKMVKPGEKVNVHSKKIYWRLGKLKCQVEMKSETGELICSGELAGMIK